MESFFAIPTSTTYTPLSSSNSDLFFDNIISPIIPTRNIMSITRPNVLLPRVVSNLGVTSVYRPSELYYYDSGIGENALAQYETNTDLRYKFLDKWLYDDFPDILRMLKVEDNSVRVLSKEEAEKNDISKDSESDLEKKSNFIAREILTISKNKKILDALVRKNKLRYYDLPHAKFFVRKAQGKYVMKKLEKMRK